MSELFPEVIIHEETAEIQSIDPTNAEKEFGPEIRPTHTVK